jgi:predicted transglutaminase-like cysteine proteinase
MNNTYRQLAQALILVVGCVLGGAAQAGVTVSAAEETGSTTVPYGWVDFCNRYAGECDGPALPRADLVLTPTALKEVEKVNRSVNAKVVSVTDEEHWGVIDRWDYPMDGKGDCEDYALLKRKLLLEHGYPRQALLMTVVKDHAGEGHAVLTIKTDKGDYVLDNLSDRVTRWDETGYRFVKRQSQEDPNRWVSLGVPTSAPLFTAR